MHRSRRAALSLAAGMASLAVSCSLLIEFNEQPSCDGGLCVDASFADVRPSLDGGPSPDAPIAPRDSGRDVEAFDAPADTAAPDGPYAPCQGLAAGAYCATDHLHGYRGSVDDLIACDAGLIARVTHCDGGCLSMPVPFPDTCSGCLGKANGTYCGRDFSEFPAGDSDFLIQCQSGNVVVNYPCPHGCGSNGASSACLP